MPFHLSRNRRSALLLLGLMVGCSGGDLAAPVSQTATNEIDASFEPDIGGHSDATDAEHVLATALSTAGIEDKNVMVHLGGPG